MYVSDANQAFTCREHWLAFVFLGFFSHAADFHSCCFSAEILLLEDNSRCFCTPQRGNGGCSASSCIDIRQPSHCFLHAAAGCAASISVTCVWSWLACPAGPVSYSSCGRYKLLTGGVGNLSPARGIAPSPANSLWAAGYCLQPASGIYLAGWHEAVGIVAMVTASFSRAGRGI